MCALIYQTTWLREFRLIFGASTAASAAVLAIFMGGLGWGSMVLGKRSDRRANALNFYATLEMGIAFTAAITPLLLWVTHLVYVSLGGSLVLGAGAATLLRLALASLVLCVPTFLMGGTLPAAARAVETNSDLSRRNLALLYGTNTLGAVAGAAISTFFLLELYGNRKTLWLACLLNLLVALTARSLARSIVISGEESSAILPFTPEAEIAVATPSGTHPAASLPATFAVIAAAITGFVFLLMELVWYRMLGPLLGGSTFTFGVILALALLGVGLGGAAYAFFGSTRSPSLNSFALTCGLEALFVGIPYALGDRIALLAVLLRPFGSVGFHGYVLAWTGVACVVVLPAALVAGIQFPMLIALLGKGRERVGRDVGLAYTSNTLGAIAGSLAGGFGLLSLLGAPGTWRLVVLILTGLCLVSLGLSGVAKSAWRRSAPVFCLAVISACTIFTVGPTAVWRHSQIGAGRAEGFTTSLNNIRDWMSYRRRSLYWERDGVESSVAVTRNEGHTFVVNGKVDGHARLDAGTQVMLGLVGAILHPAPKSALVIGLGTGSTAGWLGAVPSIERVDVVELEPAILKVAAECSSVNANAMSNPKVHVLIGDGRETLLTTPARYDLIASEPSNPYRAGIASLFTQEFYRSASRRLSDDGLFLQWLQAYEVDGETIRTVYATLSSVFPVVETFQTTYADLLLVGSMKPVSYNTSILAGRLGQEPFQTAVRDTWRVSGVEGFLAHYLANSAFASAIAHQHNTLINTDDRTPIEFGFARSVGKLGIFNVDHVARLARSRSEHRPENLQGQVDWTSVDDQRASIRTEGWVVPLLQPFFTREQRIRTEAQIRYVREDFASALLLWKSQPKEPATLTELTMVAESLADNGDPEALKLIERIHATHPTEAEALLGRLLLRQKRLEEAAIVLESAFVRYRNDPWPPPSLMERALDVATTVATLDPGKRLALRLHDAINQPFALLLANNSRLIAVLKIARYLDGGDFSHLSADAIGSFEPNIPWQFDFLAYRYRCYQSMANLKAEAAKHDLESFLAAEPSPLARGMEKESAETPHPSPLTAVVKTPVAKH
jgi:spermidine synthase